MIGSVAGKSPESWGDDYQTLRPKWEAFTGDLSRLLKTLLDEAVIDVQVEARTKDVTSFVDKIHRKNEKYADPVAEVTDLCGGRTICYDLRDVERVGELIDAEFVIDWPNSLRQGADADPDRFGYRSDHYVISLGDERIALAEWAMYRGFKAEIQVRTVMQHAWASVDHKVRYKRQDLPNELQRRLSRLSALLETADDQFASIQQESRELSAGYEQSLAGGDLDIDFDVLSLQRYVRSKEIDTTWIHRALAVGFESFPIVMQYLGNPDSAVDNADFSKLIDALREAGITSIAGADGLFRSAEDWGEEALDQICAESKLAGFVPVAVPGDVLTLLALYQAGNLAAVDRTSFNSSIRTGLKAAIRKR